LSNWSCEHLDIGEFLDTFDAPLAAHAAGFETAKRQQNIGPLRLVAMIEVICSSVASATVNGS